MNEHVFAEAGDGSLSFVGDFEELYSAERDPWGQSAEGSGAIADYYWFSRARLVEALRHYPMHSGLEIGCGHGHLTAHVKRFRAIPEMVGLDISPAAIGKARAEHPACEFLVGDIIAENFERPGRYDLVLWGQVLWYLLEHFDQALDNTLKCVKPGGVFVVSQAFLTGEQRYAREIANGFHGTLDLLSRDVRLRLLEARYDDTEKHVYRDGLLVFRVI